MDVSPRAVRTIAESAYVFLLPLVINYLRLYSEAVDESSPAFVGGFGRCVHDRHDRSHVTDLSTSHVTTLVSSAWLDLRAEPWVCHGTPSTAAPTRVITDLWGYSLLDDAAGVHHVDDPIAVASPAWIGAVPAAAARLVRAESVFVRCEASLRIHDAGGAQQLPGAGRLEPLSVWSAGVSPPAPPRVAWVPAGPETLTTGAFWRVAAFALSFTVPDDDDQGILERLAGIGVTPGAWRTPDDPDMALAIEAGMDAALAELMRASAVAEGLPTSWSRSDNDLDYFRRALAAIRLLPAIVQAS